MEAIDEILLKIDVGDRTMLTDPRHYNIRWLELLNEVKPRLENLGKVL